MGENEQQAENNVNEVSSSIKKALVATVLILSLVITTASLVSFAVVGFELTSLPAPTLDNAAKVQAIYVAKKAKLDYLFQPIDKMSSLLQILAAAVIGYILTKETVPAFIRMVSRGSARAKQDPPV